jgi:hypothetical protein
MEMRGGDCAAADSRYEIAAPYGGDGTWKNACAFPLPLANSVGASLHWSAVFGSKSCAAANVRDVSGSSGAMSTIQNPRPCVAAISSRSRGWMRRSYTGTDGKPLANFAHVRPRSMDAYTLSEVPTNSRSRLYGSSANART